MNTEIQTRADILKTVWTQDFQGVEALRASVYNVISALTVASFALSSFLINSHIHSFVRTITDIFLTMFIWVVFVVIRRDIVNRRKCLIYRQTLLESLDKNLPQADMKIFGDASKVIPDIKDTDLFWIPCSATIAILLKALILLKVWI